MTPLATRHGGRRAHGAPRPTRPVPTGYAALSARTVVQRATCSCRDKLRQHAHMPRVPPPEPSQDPSQPTPPPHSPTSPSPSGPSRREPTTPSLAASKATIHSPATDEQTRSERCDQWQDDGQEGTMRQKGQDGRQIGSSNGTCGAAESTVATDQVTGQRSGCGDYAVGMACHSLEEPPGGGGVC